jgi:hypothetical protein
VIEMMPPPGAGAKIPRRPSCREDVLPANLQVRPWILLREREREIDAAIAAVDRDLMKVAHALHLTAQRFHESLWKDRDAVFCSFTVPDDDNPLMKIDVLDAKSKSLGESKAAPVQQGREQPVDAVEPRKDGANFLTTEDHGEALRTVGANHIRDPG